MHKIGHIVLTPFPFTDLSNSKVRPALIIGGQDQGGDITVCFISSIVKNKLHKFDILVDSKDKDFKKTGLKLKSVIKTVKIATLDKSVILGKIGELGGKDMNEVKKVLKSYFEI